MNTFLIYLFGAAGLSDVVVEWFYWDNVNNNLLYLSYNDIFCSNPTNDVSTWIP